MAALQIPPNCDLTLGMTRVEDEEEHQRRHDQGRTRTTWRMVADERFANPGGVMQGGFLAAFADSAMGASAVVHARRLGEVDGPWKVANAEMKVSFLAPVAAGRILQCVAEVVGGGRRAAFVEATVTAKGADGEVVARASSTYLVTPRE